MMRELTLQEVANRLDGNLLFGDCHFKRVCTDTRNLQAGDLFVAFRGERFDANEFLQEAADKQACGLLVERENPEVMLPQLVVKDSIKAFGKLAQVNREYFQGPLLAVTGSGGKTTVKNMLSNILSGCGKVYATRGNLNNHIGVPLSLLELDSSHDYAVIEMGASGPGEIAYLTKLAKPRIGLVTNALRAHVEGFGSLEGVAKAKGELFAGLPADGIGVVNLDDPQVDVWMDFLDEKKKISFSVQDKRADVSAGVVKETGQSGTTFSLRTPDGETSVSLRLMGRHNVANAVAAAACAYGAGAGLQAIKAGLEASDPVAGRMEAKPGLRGATVIDDSYNANPDSVKAAIDALAGWPGTKVLVLGDMGELGAGAEQLHADLGGYARGAGINLLVAVGRLSREASETFGEGARHYDDCEQAIAFLRKTVSENTTVLVKGSRSSRMERVVTALTQGGEE